MGAAVSLGAVEEGTLVQTLQVRQFASPACKVGAPGHCDRGRNALPLRDCAPGPQRA
jgi:hypothetical protein